MTRPLAPARLFSIVIAAGLVALLVPSLPARSTPPPVDPLSLTGHAPNVAMLVGAGDIAYCNSDGDDVTARLLDSIPGTVFTTGDNSQDQGAPEQYRDCYEPSWGRHLARTRPAPGNHDRITVGGTGYFGYFGAAAGPAGRGYYSFAAGTWHVVVLDSNCADVGGCGADDPEGRWLRDDLSSHPSGCTLAIWHHPRFSSGMTGSHLEMRDFWAILLAARAELVIAGHDHDYERFAPQDPDGRPDRLGLREIVVGTGGADAFPTGIPLPNSEVLHTGTLGVLRLALAPSTYAWSFVPAPGDLFQDVGSAACH